MKPEGFDAHKQRLKTTHPYDTRLFISYIDKDKQPYAEKEHGNSTKDHTSLDETTCDKGHGQSGQ